MDSTTSLADYVAVYASERLDLSARWVEYLLETAAVYSRWLARPAILADLSKLPLLEFVRYASSQSSARTANNRRCALLALWNDAADKALIAPPPRRLPKCREPERIPQAWTLDEVSRILQACSQERGQWSGMAVADAWRIAILVCWDTACRRAELLAAKMADVDLTAGTWFVAAENRKGKRADKLYSLHPDTIALIAATANGRELLFPYPFQPAQAPRHLGRILERAGLRADGKHKFHCIRKTSESYAACKMGVEWAASAVGHSPEVAKRYYISPRVVPTPRLIDAIPRPISGPMLRVI